MSNEQAKNEALIGGSVTTMRLTEDNGRSTYRPEGARAVTGDGRLLWVGPILPHERHEFFLDDVNLGSVTLKQAMGSYSLSGQVHLQSNIESIASHASAPSYNV